MVKLRRIIGSAKNFKYIAEFVEFLPNCQVVIRTEEINSSSTEMRRLIEDTRQEVLINHTWKNCSLKFYNEYIQNHKKPVLKKRKAS